jgi:hypothetical protein
MTRKPVALIHCFSEYIDAKVNTKTAAVLTAPATHTILRASPSIVTSSGFRMRVVEADSCKQSPHRSRAGASAGMTMI